jgi:hypothetical protein
MDTPSFKEDHISQNPAIQMLVILDFVVKNINLLKTKADKFREKKKWFIQVLLTDKLRLNYDSSDFNEDYDLNAVK